MYEHVSKTCPVLSKPLNLLGFRFWGLLNPKSGRPFEPLDLFGGLGFIGLTKLQTARPFTAYASDLFEGIPMIRASLKVVGCAITRRRLLLVQGHPID